MEHHVPIENLREPEWEEWQLPKHQCIKVGDSDRILPERLVYISSVVSCGRDSSPQTRWISEKLRHHFDLETSDQPSLRAFISREKANFRRIANQQEIEHQLRDLGFEFHILEHMKIKEQAELFAKSAIVAGPHGAGFTNLYFSTRETKVLELFPQNDIRPHYWALSSALGLEYDCRTCETRPANFGQSDLVLNTQDLHELLDLNS
jgi:capsular polysaccharide biosynthesis protein